MQRIHVSCFVGVAVVAAFKLPANQGGGGVGHHPMTVSSCKTSVRRSCKNYLEISIAQTRLKMSRWLFHSCTTFEVYLLTSQITIFVIWVCPISLPQTWFLFYKKRNPKIQFGFQNVIRQNGIRTLLVFIGLKIQSRIFGKVISKS